MCVAWLAPPLSLSQEHSKWQTARRIEKQADRTMSTHELKTFLGTYEWAGSWQDLPWAHDELFVQSHCVLERLGRSAIEAYYQAMKSESVLISEPKELIYAF